MPQSKRKPCSYAGCSQLTHNARCEKHEKPKWFAQPSVERKERQSMYKRKSWQAMRKIQLNSHPLCIECERKGKSTLANVVDHVIPHRGDEKIFNDLFNLQSLCKKCHDKKTAGGQ